MTLVQLAAFAAFQLLSWLLLQQTILSAGGSEMIGIEFLYFFGLVLTEKCLTAFYVMHRAQLYNLLLLAIGVLYLLLLAGCWFAKINLPGQSFFWFVALQSLLQGVVLVFIFMMIQGTIQWQIIQWQKALHILKASALIMFTNIVQLLAYRIDYWLLNYYHTSFEVGMYAQANKFASLLWLLPNILAALLIPKFTSMQQEEMPAVFRIALVINLIMTFVTAIATVIIYNIFLLPEYRAGIAAFWLMLPGYFCWALVIYFGAYFSWAGAFKTNFIASSVCLLLILVADLVLIPLFSYNGAAVANTIAYTAVLMLYFFFYGRKTGGSASLFARFQKDDISFFKRILK
ncbi:MATE family efflux transporter [Pseudocnuella soli]|uniref:polysaccharide biosynthesis C-terminal domain-containing protein n=1 Tax=Pseudocnuella soli TaxID=2502779 RepID=UPI001404B954|nr:polysaccharide biosynthesis C-terminal domain-containing protein [Pseudocnuella soli]